jgi:hypothetical protein
VFRSAPAKTRTYNDRDYFFMAPRPSERQSKRLTDQWTAEKLVVEDVPLSLTMHEQDRKSATRSQNTADKRRGWTNRWGVIFDFLWECIGEPGKSAAAHSQREILPLGIAGRGTTWDRVVGYFDCGSVARVLVRVFKIAQTVFFPPT